MKTNAALICITLVGFIGACYGQNIDKTFGISSGIYLNNLKEISISYGVSNKTMILIFANATYNNTNIDGDFHDGITYRADSTFKEINIVSGPEIRGYFFSNKRLSPFAGLRASIGWVQNKNETESGSWYKTNNFQLNFGLTYGAEYFVKRNLSIYACMNLFTYSLLRDKYEDYEQKSGTMTKVTIKSHILKFEQNPALFVRFYF